MPLGPALSLSTACLPHLSLAANLRLAAAAGFSGVELVLGPQTWLRRPAQLLRLARDHGVRIHSVHQALAPLSLVTTGEERMVVAARAAVALDCPAAVIHGPWTDHWASSEGQAWLRALAHCRAIVQGSGTRLSLENPGVYSAADHANVLGRLPELLALARDQDLDLTLDTCHAGTGATGLLAAYALVRPRLSNVHLSDLRDSPGRHSPWTRAVWAHHQLPGAGYLPLGALLSQMRSDGYAGLVTLEVSVFALRGWRMGAAQASLRAAARTLRGALLDGRPSPAPGEA
ncbi:MAG: TIM barrel protein [Chloroflexota bacterium]